MAFRIKQNDTLPYLSFQIFEPDGSTPLDVTNAREINLCVRHRGGEVILKNPCVVVNAEQGLCQYIWSAADTRTAGVFQYEFEITWGDGNIQTVPVDSYLELIIVDDIA